MERAGKHLSTSLSLNPQGAPVTRSGYLYTKAVISQQVVQWGSARKTTKQTKTYFKKKKERKEFFRMLNLFQLEIILSFKVAELRRLYPFSPRESHKSNQENEKQKHHVFDKTRHLVTSNPNIWVRTANCYKGQVRVWENDERECLLEGCRTQRASPFLLSKCFIPRGQHQQSIVPEQWELALGLVMEASSDPGWAKHQADRKQLSRRQGDWDRACLGALQLPTPDVWGQERLVAPFTHWIFKENFC